MITFFSVRTCREKAVCFLFALHNQHTLNLIALLCTEVLDFGLVFISQIIETKTILLLIYQPQKRVLQLAALRGIDNTFKNRILNPLTIISTCFRDFSQPLSSRGIGGTYIIGDQDQHTTASLPQKRRILVQVTPQISRKKQSLNIRNQSPGDFLLQVRV